MEVWIVLGILALLAFVGGATALSLWTNTSRPEHKEVADLTPIVGREAEHGQTESADREVG
jgi:hypothetical protein